MLRPPSIFVFHSSFFIASTVLLSWLVVASWLRPDVQWKDVADAPNHLVRVFLVDAALQRGEWFPRWLPDLYLGYGYPLLNYYAPATYYVASALHRWGMTIYGSFQWTAAFAVLLGATGAYGLVQAVTRRVDAALLAAAVYTLSPYPFLTNLYVRAAVPEALALGLMPWLLLSAWGTWRRSGWWCAALATTTALLLLSHNISALMGVGLLVAWVALLAAVDGARRVVPWARTIASAALGLGLSAFFWLPALAESPLVQIRLAQGGFYDPRSWLFDPLHVALDAARPGYPHTPLGPVDLALAFDYHALGTAAPEKPSLWQLALWLFGLVLATLVLSQTAVSSARVPASTSPLHAVERGGERQRSRGEVVQPHSLAWLSLGWLAVAVACWFMNTIWASPAWGSLPLLALTQFPWRLYGPMALAIGVAGGFAQACFPSGRRFTWAVRAIAVAFVLLLGYGSLALRPVMYGPEPPHDVDERDVAVLEFNRYGAGTTSGGEFLPLTVGWEEDKWVGQKRGIRLYEVAYPQAGWRAGLARVIDGEATIEAIYQQPNRVVVDLEADTPATIGIHQLLFPGWRVYVDGHAVEARPAQYDEIVPASLGFIELDVPAGSHRVEARFGPTPLRAVAVALSAACVTLALLWGAWRLRLPQAVLRATLRSGMDVTPPHTDRLRHLTARAALSVGVALCAFVLALAAQSWSVRPDRKLPLSASRIVLDVASVVRQGRAETSAPSGSGSGVFPPFLDVKYQSILREGRRWLYMHPPSRVAVPVHVPPRAYFQAGLGLDPDTWYTPTGDGVRFILEAEAKDGRVTLLDQQVNPRARGEDRAWVDVWVSLAALAGQNVRLVLRTDSANDPTFDWAGWSNPQVVIWDAARPNPGERHNW